MMESWALKAIEDKAMERAVASLRSSQFPAILCGMNAVQVMALRRFYEEKTGQPADSIKAMP